MDFAEYKRIFLLTLANRGYLLTPANEIIKGFHEHPVAGNSPVLAAVNYHENLAVAN